MEDIETKNQKLFQKYREEKIKQIEKDTGLQGITPEKNDVVIITTDGKKKEMSADTFDHMNKVMADVVEIESRSSEKSNMKSITSYIKEKEREARDSGKKEDCAGLYQPIEDNPGIYREHMDYPVLMREAKYIVYGDGIEQTRLANNRTWGKKYDGSIDDEGGWTDKETYYKKLEEIIFNEGLKNISADSISEIRTLKNAVVLPPSIDENTIKDLKENHSNIITIEEYVRTSKQEAKDKDIEQCR